MGRGSRHSQSNQIKPYMTYDERMSRTNVYRGQGTTRIALDASSGTITERVGADSQKQFDACWLCNQRAVNPVLTPQGMLYCRTCIIENIAEQKKDYKHKLAEYEAQQSKEAEKAALIGAVKSAMQEQASKAIEDGVLAKSGGQAKQELAEREKKLTEAIEHSGRRKQAMNSFWVAQNTPEWTEGKVEKPDGTVRCPFTKKPLKIKTLLPVRWTEQREAADLPAVVDSSSGRYMCPISNSTFHNGTEIVIFPNGLAVSKKAFENLAKMERKKAGPAKEAEKLVGEFKCPVTGETFRMKDVIPLAKSGTAFAASLQGENAVGTHEAKKYRHSLTMAIA